MLLPFGLLDLFERIENLFGTVDRLGLFVECRAPATVLRGFE